VDRREDKEPDNIYGKFDADGKPADKGTVGQLTHFIIEPMVPHKDSDEYYIAIMSTRDGDTIMFCHEGGVNVGDVDTKAKRLEVPIGTYPTSAEIEKALLAKFLMTARSVFPALSKRCSNSTRI
jgi:succinyl-CoA synthetase beta subunit